MKHQVLYVRIASILNGRLDVIIYNELESHMTVSFDNLAFLIVVGALFILIILFKLWEG